MIDTCPPVAFGAAVPHMWHALAVSPTLPQDVLNVLTAANTMLNDGVGLVVTALVLAFVTFLLRWAVAADKSMEQQCSARGAFRSFLALFLTLHIWAIMNVLMTAAGLSPVMAYILFVASFILVGAGALFGIADSALVLIGKGADACIDFAVRRVQRYMGSTNDSEWRLSMWSAASLRLLVLAVLMTALFVVW
ncbi:hypothetical protein FJY94_01895 [Candidatus Kaiserbacteria bacterium]|nr:hypothetical protein [Candidatus Kaiserbacteria bacterium]